MPITRYTEGVEVVDSDGDDRAAFYIGPHDEDGSWRISMEADGDLAFERRESGVWVNKQTLSTDGTMS